MIEIVIPGFRKLALDHLVLDFNGTLAVDGTLQQGVREQLAEMAQAVALHVVTGNTYGTAARELAGVPCQLVELAPEGQAEAKYAFIEGLGPDATAAIGNGRNDVLMLQAAALSIAVMGTEGAACAVVTAAHVVTGSIDAALGLLRFPQRLVATLRA